MAESNGITFGGKKKKKTDIKIQKSQGDQGGSNNNAGANPGGTAFSTGGGFGGSQGSPQQKLFDNRYKDYGVVGGLGIGIAESAKSIAQQSTNAGRDFINGAKAYSQEGINLLTGDRNKVDFNSPVDTANPVDVNSIVDTANPVDVNSTVDPGFYNDKKTGVNFGGSNTLDSGDRTGNLGATSINTSGTEFSVNKLATPQGDGTTHNLELGSGDNIQQGTVSANVAAKLGRGTGSFTQLDKGVGVGDGTLFGRPASTTGTGATGSSSLSFAERANRSIGGPVAPKSAAQEFSRFNQGSLNSTNPFKRAAANRQMKQALAIDTQNAGIYKTNIVADTARSNNIDNNNQQDSEFSRKLESDNANNLRAFQGGNQSKPLSASERLAQDKFNLKKKSDLNGLINESVNLTVPGIGGVQEASPSQKLSQFMQSVKGRDIAGQDIKAAINRLSPEAGAIYNTPGISTDEKFNRLRDLGYTSEVARTIHNEYTRN